MQAGRGVHTAICVPLGRQWLQPEHALPKSALRHAACCAAQEPHVQGCMQLLSSWHACTALGAAHTKWSRVQVISIIEP